MNIKEILTEIQKNRVCKAVFEKLDNDSRQNLIGCIKTAIDSGDIENTLLGCCDDAGLLDIDLNKMKIEEIKKLSVKDLELLNKLIENILVKSEQQPPPKTDEKKKK